MAFYVLNEDKTVANVDFATYFLWLDKEVETTVKASKSLYLQDDLALTTVFLSIAQATPDRQPQVFETMLHASRKIILQRYATYEEAVQGHEAFCNLFLGPIPMTVVEG